MEVLPRSDSAMSDKQMTKIETLRNDVDGKVVLLTPEQLVTIAKKLNVRASRLNKSHLSLLCTVNDVIDKLCEDEDKALEILQLLTRDLNELLLSKETVSSEVSEEAVSGGKSTETEHDHVEDLGEDSEKKEVDEETSDSEQSGQVTRETKDVRML